MSEIIDQVVQKTGISPEKAKEVLQTVSAFLQQKFPQLAGPLQSVLSDTPGTAPDQKGANLMGDIVGKLGL